MTLSRISPEKGQDLLLDALFEWEQRKDFPQHPLWLFLCGDAAFMQGRRFLDRLKSSAARLRKTRVVFPGYVTGDRKAAFFALADLFIFPSRFESYGLTLLEALAAGLPAVCLDHIGARSVMREDFGAIVPPFRLRRAIASILADDAGRKRMGDAARRFAQGERFADRAAELAMLLMPPAAGYAPVAGCYRSGLSTARRYYRSALLPLGAITLRAITAPRYYRSALLPLRDRPVRHLDQLVAAAAHLDTDVAKSGAAELDTRSLAMIRATDAAQLELGSLLELVQVLG